MPERRTVTEKLIDAHVADAPLDGDEIPLRIDQTLTQDATGTLVMLELEAIGLDRVQTEVSAQYVDHNLIQGDFRNSDDHLFLHSACRSLGIWYSRPGNGVSHPVHMERLGKPGATLLGSDSHTCAAGSLGMLAIGSGGLEVALAMAGHPYALPRPRVWGIHLTGELPPWVSAKDVILEMLRRHGVDGGLGRVVEYHGPGVATLSAMDRHVIANMGAELGATTTVFPSDARTLEFLRANGRAADWSEWIADEGAVYDDTDEIDLETVEPLIARPRSPGNVVPVRKLEGKPIHQAYVGSSANPGYSDFAVVARIVEGRHVPDEVSLDINPTSRGILQDLVRDGHIDRLLAAGARLHQAGCNGCIGMGQAPASGRNSLRTVPRNFPGRSGAEEDSVYLCSPETAAVSALRGEITDPRRMEMACPRGLEPRDRPRATTPLSEPLEPEAAHAVTLEKGPNIGTLPRLSPLEDRVRVPILLSMGDDVSTDEILPAGVEVLPLRSNIAAISEYAFSRIDRAYASRARETGEHAVLAGRNYGQGSSREHAALAPRTLGLRMVLARSFARIHWQNLVNFGVLPLRFVDPADAERLEPGMVLEMDGLRSALTRGRVVQIQVDGGNQRFEATHALSLRQVGILLAGGLIPWVRAQA